MALDWGLIVPVIKHAEEKNVLGLSRAIQDLAARARAKQLKPDEVQGGTFTITNPGVFGALFGMPIISQPQVAIMGVGHIEKRVAVIDDAIAIRTKGYLSLGYDHRLIDGAVADEFMSHVKKTIENFNPDERVSLAPPRRPPPRRGQLRRGSRAAAGAGGRARGRARSTTCCCSCSTRTC